MIEIPSSHPGTHTRWKAFHDTSLQTRARLHRNSSDAAFKVAKNVLP